MAPPVHFNLQHQMPGGAAGRAGARLQHLGRAGPGQERDLAAVLWGEPGGAGGTARCTQAQPRQALPRREISNLERERILGAFAELDNNVPSELHPKHAAKLKNFFSPLI